MLFKEHTKSYQRKYTKEGYTFDFLVEVAITNVVYLKLVRNVTSLGDQAWKRKIETPQCGNAVFSKHFVCNKQQHFEL